MSLEKQKQLEQITQIYTVQENAHLASIKDTFQKYRADFSNEDALTVQEILSENPSQEML